MFTKFKNQVTKLFSTPKSRWLAAQVEEARFWDGISKTGYNNQDPGEFIADGQRKDMLSALEFLDILLFQINVYDSDLEIKNKSGLHADLHPHSFTRDSIVLLLNQHGFKILKERLLDTKNECDERFFICRGEPDISA